MSDERTPIEFDPMSMADVLDFARRLQPAPREQILELARKVIDLQAEAAALLAEEASRLSATREEEEAARDLLGRWLFILTVEAGMEEARLQASQAS